MSLRHAFLAVGVASLAGSALADGRITMTDGTGFYNGSDGQGGAFTATAAESNPGYNGIYGGNRRTGDGRGDGTTSFMSFCLEKNENISFGRTYYTQIATSAANGGIGGGHPDPLSAATAAVYREFRRAGTNTVLFGGASIAGQSNYNFSNGYNTSQETSAVQHAIWALEGEITLDLVPANHNYIDQLANLIVQWANANNNGALLGVRVMRLWTNRTSDGHGGWVYSGYAQDQLTLVPLPPMALSALGTLGLAGVRMALRRRSLRSQERPTL